MPELLFVLAFSYREAEQFAYDKGYQISRLRYIHNEEKSHGLRGETVYVLSGAYHHKNYSNIIFNLQVSECVIIFVNNHQKNNRGRGNMMSSYTAKNMANNEIRELRAEVEKLRETVRYKDEELDFLRSVKESRGKELDKKDAENERLEFTLNFAAGALSNYGVFTSWHPQDVYEWLKRGALAAMEGHE